MSALSYICDYGGLTSDDSDSECENTIIKKRKLPTPNLSKVALVASEDHIDDPSQHNGRLRSFPHVRGNWATFVYIKFADDIVSCLINKLKKLVLAVDESCEICDNIHLSLSKTVVLKYHFITTFTSSLQEAFSNIKSFNVQFDSVKVYCNDEESRTFIALKVDYFSKKQCLNITKKLDEVLKDFKLPLYYKEPSFHCSILWVNGNKKLQFEGILDGLNNILAQELERNPLAVLIDRIHCKVGNKHFQYNLK